MQTTHTIWTSLGDQLVTVTDEDIESLRTEAGEHGDHEQVGICDRALHAFDDAVQDDNREECARVILARWRRRNSAS